MTRFISSLRKSLTQLFDKFTDTSLGCFTFFSLFFRMNINLKLINLIIGDGVHLIALKVINFLAGNKLKKIGNTIKSVTDLVDLSFSFNFSLNKSIFFDYKVKLSPLQNRAEIIKLLNLIRIKRPKVILEIGTSFGGTLYMIAKVSSNNALLISMDLPEVGGPFGGGYYSYRIPFLKSFRNGKQKIVLLRRNSHDLDTFVLIKKILNTREIDILFIDGDHSYAGVKSDFEKYKSLVKQQGIVIFHDIVPGDEDKTGGVPVFWTELQDKYKTYEIVSSWKQGGYGIGILYPNQ